MPAKRTHTDILCEVKDQVAWVTLDRPRVEIGLINRCVPRKALRAETLKWCEEASEGMDAFLAASPAMRRKGR